MAPSCSIKFTIGRLFVCLPFGEARIKSFYFYETWILNVCKFLLARCSRLWLCFCFLSKFFSNNHEQLCKSVVISFLLIHHTIKWYVLWHFFFLARSLGSTFFCFQFFFWWKIPWKNADIKRANEGRHQFAQSSFAQDILLSFTWTWSFSRINLI